MTDSILGLDDLLPLSCTRAGTCCHGKDIRVTPWELHLLARDAGQTAAAFRDQRTTDGGTRLRCDGQPGWRGLPACTLYDAASGCTRHAARPLACRLFPLGRRVVEGRVEIIHEGRRFPCLDGCPQVERLPHLRVGEYLAGQGVDPFAAVHGAYLEIAQDLAEAAFVIVFETGLQRQGGWQADWRSCVAASPRDWPGRMLPGWHDHVTAPALAADPQDGTAWAAAHRAAMQSEAQRSFGALTALGSLRAASRTCLAGALLLLHGVGADVRDVGRRFLERAGCA